MSGCYCTITIIYRGLIITSNVGNSKSVLIRKKINLENQDGIATRTVKSFASGSSNAIMIDSVKASMYVYKAYSHIYSRLYGAHSLPHITMTNYFTLENLSTDHAVSDYDELLRIKKEGGIIRRDMKNITFEHYLCNFKLYSVKNESYPILAARCLGQVKAKKAGATCSPSVKIAKRGENDMFLLVGSYGFWYFF